MPSFPPANIAESDQSLFSPGQMDRLMRGEFFRAKRYDYPLVAMLIAVDRLGSLQDLYGYESKREILRGVVDLLRNVTRQGDYLGTLVDDRLLAIFPHTDRRGAGAIAWRLLKGARELQFDSDGRLVQITLSIGASDSRMAHVEEFDDLLQASGAGLATSVEAGGDRYIVREEVVRELAAAQDELDELRPPAREPAPAPAPAAPEEAPANPLAALAAAQPAMPPPPPIEGIDDEREVEMVQRIHALFSSLDEVTTPGLVSVQEQLIALALSGLRSERALAMNTSSTEYQDRIKNLERRLAKLSRTLGMTEEELKRVMRLKNIDPGMASIYREVQGLSADDDNVELKQELMSKIFEANLELRRSIGAQD